ncbi:MAG: SRPBCC family protein [Gemmatimonadota bacterium]
MRWLLGGVGIVIGVLAVLAGIGYSMPNAHVAQAEADYRSGPDSVYAILSDIEAWPEWHPSAGSLTPVGDSSEPVSWRIRGPDGSMTITLIDEDPPQRFVTLADGGMFIGRWTYKVEERAGRTRVTITEEARIDNLVIRGLTVFRNQTSTLVRVLRALGDRLGERVEPRGLT